MFGGPSKLGRGGGAGRGFDGGPKRFSSLSQPIRPPGPPHGRLSMPGPRSRTPAPPAAPPAVEETFSLVSGKNPLTFAMIIRLAPDLIDEIRRLEAQGGAARIKFDANPNNSSGNVIDVGGKEFRFTWSKEFGDLCDIYEERQHGEDGNGLLVESGSAWRKLNVQRVLDESTTNHVKMRSVEAERKKEQRKTIILDNGNPKTKKQVPASEANPWRPGFKKKEPPPKKRKVDTPLVPSGATVKPTQKSGSPSSSSKPVGKGPRSVSPLPFPQDPFQEVASPLSGQNISKYTEEIIVPTQLRKEDSDRDLSIKSSGLQDKSGSKLEIGAKPSTDLQSMITSLLKENPKGMSLKALEKAIGDTFPSSGKKIEPILKRIAVYQAPGRYLLKQEPEAEGTKGPSPGRTSSFDYSNIQIPASASEPTFDKEVRQEEGLAELNTTEFDTSENIDIEQHSPDILGDKKDSVRDSSSDSGSSSDSDSASSDSGSDSPSGSRSRSKSRSPVRSGGSSDSESADSSNKEGSDEEVDIISDDDKPKPGQDPGPAAPSPPIPNGNDSDIVDIDGEDVNEERPESVRGGGSPNQDDVQAKQNLIGSLFEDDSTFGGPDPTFRGNKSKRGTDIRNDDVGPGHVKRSRVENVSTPPIHVRYSSSPHEPTPNWSRETTKLPLNQTVPGKFSNLPPQQQLPRLSGQQPTSYDSSWRINKHSGPGESFGQVGAFSDKSHNADLGRSSKGTPESYGPRPNRSGPSGRHSLPFESHKNLGSGPGLGPGPIFKESPRVNGRGPVLQREVSDLELGELREPIPEEGPTKKTFERRASFNDTRPKPPPKSENFPRQRTFEQRDDEAAIPQPQIPSRPTNANGTVPVSKIAEVKFKRNGIFVPPGIVSDKDGPPKIDNRTAVAQTKKETRTQVVVANGGKKRKESSSDENSCSYLKYEKDEPELKGRIRDLSQYNEYVQEYSEKYDSYCSLNKVLESYRQDFVNLGRELDSARGGRDTDRYNNIESQIMESYRKCGTKHKRLKKIFTVLHEELKHLKRMITDFVQVNSKD